MTSPRTPRPLDHLVLPVEDLDTARARHQRSALPSPPMRVILLAPRMPASSLPTAPISNHWRWPRVKNARRRREGNVFVARDQAHRFRWATTAFQRFGGRHRSDAGCRPCPLCRLGMSGGDMLDLLAADEVAGWLRGHASFKLAFAADLRAPDFFGFAVERINVPAADRSALTMHANGVAGISEVILSEPNPTDFQYFIQELC
jgi:hypothetical protein